MTKNNCFHAMVAGQETKELTLDGFLDVILPPSEDVLLCVIIRKNMNYVSYGSSGVVLVTESCSTL